MPTRREFVQLSSLALPALAAAWGQKHIPLGLELYTVRDLVKRDLPSTLRQIRAIGYEQVELIPAAYKYSAPELRKIVADSGLRAPCAHIDYDAFPSSFSYAKELGLDLMLISALPDSMRSSRSGFEQGAAQLNAWGKRARELGMRAGFHTHDYEFRPLDGITGFEILRRETDPELVFFELDCYWVAQAGLDPVAMLRDLGRRVRVLHLKDRKRGFPPSYDTGAASAHFTEVGSGSLDWPAILAQARQLDVPYYFVEQDQTSIPPMESIRISYNYLKPLLH